MKKTIQQLQREKVCSDMIREFAGDNKVPERVDIESFITEYLGYRILYENFAEKNKLGFTSDGITSIDVIRDGIVMSIRFPEKVIVIDKVFKDDSQIRNRREILAHEAGHIVYGIVEGENPSGYYTDKTDGYADISFSDIQKCMSSNENEADQYAVALLMPDYVVMNLMKEFHDGMKFPVYDKIQFLPEDRKVFEKIAGTLNVSKTALYHRLRQLGGLVDETENTYLSKLNLQRKK